MRRFRFRLDPLLRLRGQLERLARRELAQATAALQAVDRQLAAAAEGRREFAETAAHGGATGLLARALEQGLLRHEWLLLGQQRRASAQFEAARHDYLTKARDLGALERMELEQREAWRATAQREEQVELDEMARLARAGAARGASVGGGAR